MKPIALTQGDPDGIGPEIALACWEQRDSGLPPFFIIADIERLERTRRQLGFETALRVISTAEEAGRAFGSGVPVMPVNRHSRVSAALTPGDEISRITVAAIEHGVALVLQGEASALVTNPISKERLQRAGFAYPGHTDFLGALARDAGLPATPVMMLAGPDLRTVPVTVHIPLEQVAQTLSSGRIVETAEITAQGLQRFFHCPSPRLAVTGLNPHAGEGGTMGREEIGIIAPAIDKLRAQGLAVTGPHPADTLFHAAARRTYDAVIAMYHDQALIPVKTLAFDESVNVTLGLPFIRTSPDHGTAFDIAGKGIARPGSLIAALKLAASMAGAA